MRVSLWILVCGLLLTSARPCGAGAEPAGADPAGAEPADSIRLSGPQAAETQSVRIDNLVAFARLYGYARYYHPSDQNLQTDWELFAIAGVRAVEDAETPEKLVERLQRLFAFVAPGLEVGLAPATDGYTPPGLPEEALAPEPPADDVDARKKREVGIAWWHHFGFCAPEMRGKTIYNSVRETGRGALWESPEAAAPALGEAWVGPLTRGLWCRVPLVLVHLPGAGGGTLPRPAAGAVRAEETLPADLLVSGDDRSTRLACVVIAWNIFQHYYPYFDVVQVDWPNELRRGLAAAGRPQTEAEFVRVLSELVAVLRDGHGGVAHPSWSTLQVLPLAWEWVEEQLIVTAIGDGAPPEVRPGDLVAMIDGRPTAEVYAEWSRHISASTPQHARHAAASAMSTSRGEGPRHLVLVRPDGSVYQVQARTRPFADEPPVKERRPDPACELKPGIWYLDLDRLSDHEFTGLLPRLADARGLIFDLRGYPSSISIRPLAHLTDRPLQSARWLIPICNWPDRWGRTFQPSRWPVAPAQPRLTSNTVFITDGRAVSYAETYLGIVEHFQLAQIVGQPTAGTNGNVTAFDLPGGYRVTFTGMKVLKHDGNRHHGVGIIPTRPVQRTIAGIAAGRDELLDAALAIVDPAGDGPSSEPARREPQAPPAEPGEIVPPKP